MKNPKIVTVTEGGEEWEREVRRRKQKFLGTSFATLERLIDGIRRLDYKSASLAHVEHRTDLLLDYYYAFPRPITLPILWRARKGPAGCRYSNVSQYWYPRAEYARAGRLNAAGDPVFYCAPKRNIAGLEVRPDLGDWVTLVEAEKRVDEPMTVLPLGLERCGDAVLNALGYTPARDYPPLQEALRTPSSYRKWCLIDNFLNDLLAQVVPSEEEERYKATIALARTLRHYCDGILYPSIATRWEGVNLCLSREAVDRLYKPVRCHIMEVVETSLTNENGLREVVVREVCQSKSINCDGTIEWPPVTTTKGLPVKTCVQD